MGVHLRNPDYDRDIVRLPNEPIMLNEIDPRDFCEVDLIKQYMVTEIKDDTIETLPTCDCGRTHGRYNARTSQNKATVCRYCNTEVISPIERGFKSDVWVSAPEGIVGFIRTNFLRMLRKTFKMEGGISVVDWLCNPRIRPANEYGQMYQRLLSLNLPRGYNEFIINFDEIFKCLITPGVLKTPARDRREIETFVLENRDVLFPKVLPLPSKRSIITEQSDTDTYIVEGYGLIIDGVRQLSDLKADPHIPMWRRERIVYNFLLKFCEYNKFVDRKILCKKEGWYRKQIMGSRAGPSYRGVIKCLAGQSETDGMSMPWRIAIGTYEIMLVGELIRMGATVNDCKRLLIEAMNRFDPEIDRIFDKFKRESFATTVKGTPGLPQAFGRNPTLDIRSIQALVAIDINNDLSDNTIGISSDILTAPNADFDGDQMNGQAILCLSDWNQVKHLRPHTGIMNLNSPHSLNKNMKLRSPTISNLNNFIYGARRQ